MRSDWLCGALALAVCASFGDPDTTPKIVTGVLLNALDQKPLPEYTFVVQATGDPLSSDSRPNAAWMERLTTRADGTFTSVRAFPIRPLELTPIDWESTVFTAEVGGLPLPRTSSPRMPANVLGVLGPDDRVTFRVAFDGKPLEILMPSGPTFDLEFGRVDVETGGPVIGASTARLIATGSNAVDEGAALTTTVRTLDPDHGWARFAALPRDAFSKPRGARLEVVAADGKWKAVLDVSEQLEKGVRRVKLEWKPCARWSGSLRGLRTSQLVPNWISAERVADDGGVLERRRVSVGPDGSFLFQGLEPGAWRLTTRPLRAKAYTGPVKKLTLEEPVSETIDLERIEARLVIAGRAIGGPVVKGAGEPERARVVLRRADEPLPFSEIGLVWAAVNERWVAEFSFTELPEGEYEIDIVTADGEPARRYGKTSVRVKSGGAAVTFSTP